MNLPPAGACVSVHRDKGRLCASPHCRA